MPGGGYRTLQAMLVGPAGPWRLLLAAPGHGGGPGAPGAPKPGRLVRSPLAPRPRVRDRGLGPGAPPVPRFLRRTCEVSRRMTVRTSRSSRGA